MTRRVTIKTGARLHFGFLSCKPQSGREFGGAGVMIDSPGFDISVAESDEFIYDGPPAWRSRVATIVDQLRDATVDDTLIPPMSASTFAKTSYFDVNIRDEIPAHAGLGSGTQLAMALATAAHKLRREREASVSSVAHSISRGERSAIGIHGFDLGGFLVDAGKLSHQDIGALAARTDFPAGWRFVLALPAAQAGLSGTQECAAFDDLTPMPAETTDRLCSVVLTRMLPAVVEADFEQCGEAIFDFGKLVGEYFAPVQGGTYVNRQMADFVSHLRDRGIRGVGQTSWGPTIFALCRSQEEAEQLAHDLSAGGRWPDCRFVVSAARNAGAEVLIEAEH